MRADLYPVRGLVLKAVGFDCVGGREGGASNGVSPITDAPLTPGVWTPPPLVGGGSALSLEGPFVIIIVIIVTGYYYTDTPVAGSLSI